MSKFFDRITNAFKAFAEPTCVVNDKDDNLVATITNRALLTDRDTAAENLDDGQDKVFRAVLAIDKVDLATLKADYQFVVGGRTWDIDRDGSTESWRETANAWIINIIHSELVERGAGQFRD